MAKLTSRQIRTFQEEVYTYFEKHGRDLPWRKEPTPYHVLVSEVMLQQTQVDRVVPKYQAFLRAFPTVQTLASASLGDVLSVWQGMGYNRRAKFLHQAAQVIVNEHGGSVPKDVGALESLPGIGPATARSIAVFAFNQPCAFIETNVRSVIIHHFLGDTEGVLDTDVLFYVEHTIDKENPRRWYNALMDYGTYLKKAHGNPSRRSKHHTRQKPFEGSDRQVRGAILRLLTERPHTKKKLSAEVQADKERLVRILTDLEEEGFIKKEKRSYTTA